jgi:hypothetical protein
MEDAQNVVLRNMRCACYGLSQFQGRVCTACFTRQTRKYRRIPIRAAQYDIPVLLSPRGEDGKLTRGETGLHFGVNACALGGKPAKHAVDRQRQKTGDA